MKSNLWGKRKSRSIMHGGVRTHKVEIGEIDHHKWERIRHLRIDRKMKLNEQWVQYKKDKEIKESNQLMKKETEIIMRRKTWSRRIGSVIRKRGML